MFGECVPHLRINPVHAEPVAETHPVLHTGLAPLHLAQRRQTGQEHVLQVVVRSDVLRPEVCLHAEDMRQLLGCQIGHRVERIDFVDGHAAPDPEGFGIGVG